MLLVSCFVTQEQHKVCMVVPETTTRCFQRFRRTPISDMAAKVSCLQDLFWDYDTDNPLTGGDMSYFRKLTGENRTQWDQISPKWRANGVVHAALSARATNLSSPSRWREMPRLVEVNLYPPSGYRVRREYRTMTISERDALHRALRIMNIKGEIEASARLYAKAAETHHGGASFLPWNRMFLMLFEEAMLKHEPDVFLPYWASTLDDAMNNPVTSLLWTAEYLGNGHGDVYTGPAANWVTRQGYLQREYGRMSRLLKISDIHKILSKCRIKHFLKQITIKRGKGVLMEILKGRHSKIYSILQLIGARRSVCGVDPAEDYPKVSPDGNHAADVKMLGFHWWTNKDGLKAQWTDNWYSIHRNVRTAAPVAQNLHQSGATTRETSVSAPQCRGKICYCINPRLEGCLICSDPEIGAAKSKVRRQTDGHSSQRREM
ncbi:LOW QUALITY PROTEIN: TYR3-like protein [Mya arenaria]|uniref:TYR3-like protein n=1 Tax=Mya arenaria TaxID=6604 RepID=A0ABY7ESL6_MYAAR|nr:LOW QUALITY PROTEIN: TYR3-like protein [Mya arenaria]